MIRTLLVDDSPVIRRMFARVLSAQPDIEVIAEAPDPYVARDIIVLQRPDVVVLDVEMPRMDGITFLRKLMLHYPLPVVVCSSFTPHGGEVAIEAMVAGAVEVIGKPSQDCSLIQMAPQLVAAVRNAKGARPQRRIATRPTPAPVSQPHRRSLIALGASTGGTVAIETILQHLPCTLPPIVIVQHMPAYMTPLFASRLNKISPISAREATNAEPLTPGLALIAPGGKHLLVERSADGGFRARVKEGPTVNGHHPSVDVLFSSVARVAGKAAVGVLLTGMGKDGARGLLQMRTEGARTFAQDEASSVVYGMPKVALEMKAVDEVLALEAIPDALLRAVHAPL